MFAHDLRKLILNFLLEFSKIGSKLPWHNVVQHSNYTHWSHAELLLIQLLADIKFCLKHMQCKQIFSYSYIQNLQSY